MKKPKHKRAKKKRKNPALSMPPMMPGMTEALCDLALFSLFKRVIGGSSRSILEKIAEKLVTPEGIETRGDDEPPKPENIN